MKKILLLLLCFVLTNSSILAQSTPPTVAMDFTADDCDGLGHNLFAELEDGNVILMEFIMLDPCMPCVRAREALQPMYMQFNESHPGKFRIYTIGWTNSITCKQIQGWMEKYGFMNMHFPGNGDLTDYYGGMGMPTIALVAGKDHKVLYVNDVQNGFNKADTTLIKSLIAEALTNASVGKEMETGSLSLYPNPASGMVRIALSGELRTGAEAEVRITNLLGMEVLRANIYATGDAEVDVSSLAAGTYSVFYRSGHGEQYKGLLIKQ